MCFFCFFQGFKLLQSFDVIRVESVVTCEAKASSGPADGQAALIGRNQVLAQVDVD